jgi:hypothetical protein
MLICFAAPGFPLAVAWNHALSDICFAMESCRLFALNDVTCSGELQDGGARYLVLKWQTRVQIMQRVSLQLHMQTHVLLSELVLL